MQKKAIVLFMLRLVRMSISILILMVSAKAFGVSLDRDMWILGSNAILVVDMAIWGPINETFRVKFISFKETLGQEVALKKAQSMLVFINLVTIAVVIILFLSVRYLSVLIAPSYGVVERDKLVLMLQLLIPSLFFNQLTQFFSSILNAFNIFFIPEIATVVTGVLNVVLIYFLAPKFGIYAMVAAYYVNLLFLMFLLTYRLRKENFNNSFHYKFAWEDVKPFVLFALPFFLPYFFGQLNGLLEKTIASTLNNGAVSIIDYSRKFLDIITTVISSVLTTLTLPLLTAAFLKNDHSEFRLQLRQMLSLGFMLTTIIVALFTACPNAFIHILYDSNKISIGTLDTIASMTTYYSWASVAIFVYLIFGMALLASDDGKFYAVFGSIAQILMIGFNFALNKEMGIFTFPISLFLSHFIAAIFMLTKFRLKDYMLFKNIAINFIQIVLITFLAWFFNYHYNYYHISNNYLLILANSILILILVIAYSLVFKPNEFNAVINLVLKRKGKVK